MTSRHTTLPYPNHDNFSAVFLFNLLQSFFRLNCSERHLPTRPATCHFDRMFHWYAPLVLHVIRSANPVMLSEAKHFSHYSAPLSFLSLVLKRLRRFRSSDSHCHFDRARPIVMLSEAKHLSHYSALCHFDRASHCHFDRAERVEKSGMLCAAPSSEYTVSDDYSAGAAGSSTLRCSPRAWLLPFSLLEWFVYGHVMHCLLIV